MNCTDTYQSIATFLRDPTGRKHKALAREPEKQDERERQKQPEEEARQAQEQERERNQQIGKLLKTQLEIGRLEVRAALRAFADVRDAEMFAQELDTAFDESHYSVAKSEARDCLETCNAAFIRARGQFLTWKTGLDDDSDVNALRLYARTNPAAFREMLHAATGKERRMKEEWMRMHCR